MRAPRRTLVVLVVLAGLLVGADRLAVHLAEREAAERIRSAEGVSSAESTSVSIAGFPFLTQALDRKLEEVDVEIDGMTTATADRHLPITRMRATLEDVRLGDDYRSATAARARGTAEISYDDLNELAPGIEASYAGENRAGRNQVAITASIDVMGQKLTIPEAIHGTVEVTDDDRLRLRADMPGDSFPGAEQLKEQLDFTTGISGLPSGLTLNDAEVTQEGVRFTLSGTDVPLG